MLWRGFERVCNAVQHYQRRRHIDKELFDRLETYLSRPVVLRFTNFVFAVV